MADTDDMTTFTPEDLAGLSDQEQAAVGVMADEDRAIAGEAEIDPAPTEAPPEAIPPQEAAPAAGPAPAAPPPPLPPPPPPPQELPDLAQYDSATAKVNDAWGAALENFKNGEIDDAAFDKAAQEHTAAIARIAAQRRDAERLHEQARATANEEWYGLLGALKESNPVLFSKEHITRFDQMVRQIDASRPDLTDAEKIDLAAWEYARAAQAVGMQITLNLPGSQTAASATPQQAAAPPQRPAAPPPKAPPTLHRIPAETGNGEFGGEFGHILSLTERAAASGDSTGVFAAEDAIARMSDEAFDVFARQLSGG